MLAPFRGFLGLLALLLCGCDLPRGPQSPGETCVLESREHFNRAIAERDTAAFRDAVVRDVRVTTGAGAFIQGVEAYQAVILEQAEDDRFETFHRSTQRVLESGSHALAAESGTWEGVWVDPVSTLSGVYLAQWEIDGAGCRIRSELFVTLECSGDRCPP